MNTDKPDEGEGMASKEPMAEEDSNSSKEKKSLKKPALIIGAAVLFAIAILMIPIYLYKDNAPKQLNPCPDNLRAIDIAIQEYEGEYGKCPASLDELVPTYIRVTMEEPSGGFYYLDTTTTPPKAICSKGHTY
jgi:hypothetical protein